MKIIFFGTSNFSAEILESLTKSENEIVAVVTQPDKPVGRKQDLQQSPVSLKATELGLRVLKPASLKSLEVEEELSNFKPDLFVVVAYGKIIPKNILNIPKIAPINIHGSLLPKYRGASPIQTVILNGDSETGITIMYMDEQMDHGPILFEGSVIIGPDETFPEVEKKLLQIAKTLIRRTIETAANGELPAKEQDHSVATFTKIITKEDGEIDWNSDIQKIYNQYRAFIVWPGVWTTFENKILKIKKAALLRLDINAEPGTVSEKDGAVFVACLGGALELLEVQVEGKNPVPIKDFVNGHKSFIGAKLI